VSNDKYYDLVLAYITEHGESGVNTLANAFDIPLSTMQKYLERQSYFKKTERRKWDLPENVNADIKSDTMVLMVDSVENALLLIKSQVTDLQLSLDSSLIPISTLKRGINNITAPAATKSIDIHPSILQLNENAKITQTVFKKYVGVCPQKYQDLIKNLDLYKLIIEKGTDYLNAGFNADLTALFLEQTTDLAYDTVQLLNQYQKEA